MPTLFSKRAFVLLMMLSLGGCAMFSGRETAGQYVDDATITTRLKADIINDPKLSIMQIHVETMQGVVQLSGFVDSIEAETNAVGLARNEKGVSGVKNSLIVRRK